MPIKKYIGRRPVALIILDGWGRAPAGPGNAIMLAEPKNFTHYYSNYPRTVLGAAEEHVGLIKGIQGSSEVGHPNIGAGRIVYQNLARINKAIANRSIYKNKALLGAMAHVKKHRTALHLMGLMSEEGVHGVMAHLYAIMRLAKKKGVKKVWLHFFSDGRDTAPKAAKRFMRALEEHIKRYGLGTLATVMGRYYSMDRDTRWPRIKKAFDTIVHAKGKNKKDGIQAIDDSYRKGVNDEFIVPVTIGDYPGVKKDDAMIFFNYRTDRTRQLTKAIIERMFEHFDNRMPRVHYVAMTEYYKGMKAGIAFPPIFMKNILGEVISKNGLRQLRIAETEKYAHVTFFFNGALEQRFKGEDRILVHSPKVATYDLQPEMSAYPITEKVLKAIKSERYDFIVLNYANPDMVGHTGIIPAAVSAIRAVDECLGMVVDRILAKDGVVLITADHGNAEKMLDCGKPWTAHTLNKVDFIIVANTVSGIRLKDSGVLGDIAPTILEVMGIKKPKEMDRHSLFLHK